jgi:D-amino-acid oxidase
VRGQLVVTDNPGVTEFFSEDTGDSPDLLCIYPHRNTVVLGGTAEAGNWNTHPDPATASDIVRRCAEVIPALAHARIREHRVGLRPTLPSVRVEATTTATGTNVIHNYGHGGAGVTLSWGCARTAAAIAHNLHNETTEPRRRPPASP